MLEEGTSCGFAAGQYAVLTDWINSGFAGCPTYPSRVVILAEDNTGKYAVISRSSNGPDFGNLDTVGTTTVAAYPTVYYKRTSAAADDPAVFTVNLTGVPANGNGAYASGDAPPGPVITGYQVYYQNATSLPSPVLPGSWVAATNGTISGASTASQANVQVPKPGSGQLTYLMTVMTFDSGFTSSFLPDTQGNVVTTWTGSPTASPLFANVTADPTTVAWTSGDESRVASYQAYMSLTANGTYRAIGQPVAALGSGHSYTVNYRVVAPTYYVKIKASKTDGTFVWSSAVKVTRLAPAPKPLPGKPLPGKAGLRK
jgi:hypothetical protein